MRPPAGANAGTIGRSFATVPSMSDLPLPLLIAVVFFFLCWFLLRQHFRFQDEQAALPQREAYLAAHGQRQPACHACGSQRLSETGLSHGGDERRIVRCADCRTLLFQFRREADEEAQS
jgi:hypothetical protein